MQKAVASIITLGNLEYDHDHHPRIIVKDKNTVDLTDEKFSDSVFARNILMLTNIAKKTEI